MKAKEYLQVNRAALFDWIVLLTSFLLGFVFPSLADFVTSGGFSNWILASLLLYIVGAALKHLPLSYRLTNSGKDIPTIPYIIFLVVGHWFIILLLLIFAEPAIRHILQLPPLTDKNAAGWQIIAGSIIAANFVTWLVYRTKSKRKKRTKYSERHLFWQEIIADILLIAGVSVFSYVFWEKGVIGMLGRASKQTISDIWFLFVFLAILFLFFYLPLRYLFFVEDMERGRNRRRLMLIFVFILVKALFEMMGI